MAFHMCTVSPVFPNRNSPRLQRTRRNALPNILGGLTGDQIRSLQCEPAMDDDETMRRQVAQHSRLRQRRNAVCYYDSTQVLLNLIVDEAQAVRNERIA